MEYQFACHSRPFLSNTFAVVDVGTRRNYEELISYFFFSTTTDTHAKRLAALAIELRCVDVRMKERTNE